MSFVLDGNNTIAPTSQLVALDLLDIETFGGYWYLAESGADYCGEKVR